MIKKIKFIALSVMLAVTAVTGAGVYSQTAKADETAKTLSLYDAVKNTAENNGALISGETFDYTVGVSEHTVTNNAVSNDFVFKSFDNFDKELPRLKFSSWKQTETAALSGNPYGPQINVNASYSDANGIIRVNRAEGVSVKLLFKKNAKLSVTHDEITGIVATDKDIRIRIYTETDGKQTLVTQNPLYSGNSAREANSLGAEINVKSGTTVYYEYGAVGGWEKTLKAKTLGSGMFVNFTADTESYDNSFGLTLNGMAEATATNGFNSVEYNETVDFSVKHGKLGAEVPFDVTGTNLMQTTERNDGGTYASVYFKYVDTLMRTNGEKDVIVVELAFKKNVKIMVKSDEIKSPTNGTAYYKYYVKRVSDGENFYKNLETFKITNTAAEENAIGFTASVTAGDSFVAVIYGSNCTTNIYLQPDFKIDEKGYNESESFDFTETIEFAGFVKEQKTEIKRKYDELFSDTYETAYLEKLYNDFITETDKAETKEEVKAAADKFNALINDVETKTQVTAAIEAAKTRLNDYVSALDKNKYSEKDYNEILSIKEKGLSEIESVKTSTAAKTKADEIIGEIGLLPVLEVDNTPLIITIIVLAVILGAAAVTTVVILKRRKKTK